MTRERTTALGGDFPQGNETKAPARDEGERTNEGGGIDSLGRLTEAMKRDDPVEYYTGHAFLSGEPGLNCLLYDVQQVLAALSPAQTGAEWLAEHYKPDPNDAEAEVAALRIMLAEAKGAQTGGTDFITQQSLDDALADPTWLAKWNAAPVAEDSGSLQPQDAACVPTEQAGGAVVSIGLLNAEQQADIRAHVEGLSDQEEDTYDAPEHGWTCFHCGQTFKTHWGASLHFGDEVKGRPACGDMPKLLHIYDRAVRRAQSASPARIDYQSRIDGVHEARRAILAGGGLAGPVAWRCRQHPAYGWSVHTSEAIAKTYVSNFPEGECQPLYAAPVAEGEREALRRQTENMAFVLNRVDLHGWGERFERELAEDRAILQALDTGTNRGGVGD